MENWLEELLEALFDDEDAAKEETTKKQNMAKEEEAGEYKIVINDNSVEVTDKDGCHGVAKCHVEDKFDIGEGVRVAINNLLAERSRKIKEAEDKTIHVGDVARIVDNLDSYTTYSEWVYNNVKTEAKCRYCYDSRPQNGLVGKVIAMGKHPYENANLYYIDCDGNCYLLCQHGIKKVN